MQLNDTIKDFKAETPDGPFQLYDYIKDCWCLLISHPGVYTPVCTTELADMIKQDKEFKDRGVKVVAITFDTTENTAAWIKEGAFYVLYIHTSQKVFVSMQDINTYAIVNPSNTLPFPLIADKTRVIGVQLGMIRPEDKDKSGLQLSARHAVILDKNKKVKCFLVYPASTGRNMPEILRAIDSLQLTANIGVSTGVNWKPSDSVIVPTSIPPEEANKVVKNITVKNLPSEKPYLQFAELKCQSKKKGGGSL
ncbi:peroxiredoxin-6-like [Leptodactylus fuscus]|uniref:peroxiredoxin-6-like n=1 Tax=Leptodactylus fuscus TaxID=238119 RepID=UPI003F4E929E